MTQATTLAKTPAEMAEEMAQEMALAALGADSSPRQAPAGADGAADGWTGTGPGRGGTDGTPENPAPHGVMAGAAYDPAPAPAPAPTVNHAPVSIGTITPRVGQTLAPTRADAERALAAVRGNLGAIIARAQAVFRAVPRGDAGATVALARDYAAVRWEATTRGPYDSPDPAGIALVWLKAEARWQGYATGGVPHALSNAALAPVPAFAPSPAIVPRLLATLASRGITLSTMPDGKLAASPVGMLNDTDRALIVTNRAALIEALSNKETL